jgi:serine/threonine protein phosphatase PrpC
MIAVERAHLYVAALSHPGMSGKNNEDRYSVSAYQIGTTQPVPSLLAIIADGIGGHRAGEIAAEIAVERIRSAIAAADGQQPISTLANAITQASQAILEQAAYNPQQQGMGSTCACAWIIADRLYIANVGDSRVYLLRDRTIRQLSIDHTWVQEAIDHGVLSPEEAHRHPNAHVIRRYLGSRQAVVPDMRLRLRPTEGDEQARSNQGVRLQPGDQIVLCSDGLTDLVSASEIATVLQQYPQEQGLQMLVDMANQRGGHDNITIISLQVPQRKPVEAVPAPVWQRKATACVGFGVLAIVIAFLLGGLYWALNLSGDKPTPLATQPLQGPIITEMLMPSQQNFTSTSGSLEAQPATQTPLPTRTQQTPLASPSPTMLRATLTPWPTNTTSPSKKP